MWFISPILFVSHNGIRKIHMGKVQIRTYLFCTFLILAFTIPLSISLYSVILGNIPFWYDNARDMLLSLDNLAKPTLIGPTSGIPGIFYGPYWIWLLSFSQLFSKDPRSATFIVGILPYFVFFPLVLLQFSKLFRLPTIILIWLLFIFSSGMSYATNMWNPHLAPLLFLILIYLLVFTDNSNKNIARYGKILLAGLVAGFIINFHISFGLGVFLGTVLFFLVEFLTNFIKNKAKWRQGISDSVVLIILFLLGLFITFIPFLLFEVRHGFNQIETAINAFTKYGAVVSLKGLSKEQILQSFFGRVGTLLHIPGLWAYIGELLTLGFFFIAWKYNKLKLGEHEKKLIKVLFAISIGILSVFLTAKNPVWSYHFIGTEIIFLLLIALIVSNISVLRYLLAVWVLFIVSSYVFSFGENFRTNRYASSSLYTKSLIVDLIGTDAGPRQYTVFNYSPSIYQYEYSYLFRWKYNKDVPFDPGTIYPESKRVYVIVPNISESAKKGYVNYRAPDTYYNTTKTWEIPDGTVILKREKSR